MIIEKVFCILMKGFCIFIGLNNKPEEIEFDSVFFL